MEANGQQAVDLLLHLFERLEDDSLTVLIAMTFDPAMGIDIDPVRISEFPFAVLGIGRDFCP